MRTQKKATRTGLHSARQPALKALSVTAVCSAMLLLAPLAAADDQFTWFGEVAEGQWLLGAKLGVLQPNIDGYESAHNAAILVGYQFARPVGDNGSTSIELEASVSADTDIHNSNKGVAEYDVQTFGLFFNYRSPGTVYFKGKLGVVDSNIDTRYPDGTEALPKLNDTAFAFGLGAGVRLGGNNGRTTIEAEWVSASGDNDINYYNLGGNIEF